MGMTGSYIAVDDTLLNQIISGEESLLDFIDSDAYETLDIDKSWHAVHYLLCGEISDGEPPMGYAVPMLNENNIDCEEDFIGAFYLTPRQVEEASGFLNALSDDDLKKMYDFGSMLKDEIYPLTEDDEESEIYEYIYSYLEEIKEYFGRAAEKSLAVIFYIM